MAIGRAALDEELLRFIQKRGLKPDLTLDRAQIAAPTLEASRREETKKRVVEALAAAQHAVNPAAPPVGPFTGAFNFQSNIQVPQVQPLAPVQPRTQKAPQQTSAPNTKGYVNGQLSPDQLVSIGRGHYLQPAAAQAWQRMVADAAKDGVNITITDSYRDLATQQRLYKEKGDYSKGGLAAKPGTSKHGLGLATDVNQGREWLAKHGNKYGFYTIPREPWHWEYRGGGVNQGGNSTTGNSRGGRNGRGTKNLPKGLRFIIGEESDGNVHADNPTSTAFGIGQLPEVNRQKYGRQLGVDPNTTNRREQLAMMLAYINDRYGSIQAAVKHHKEKGWY